MPFFINLELFIIVLSSRMNGFFVVDYGDLSFTVVEDMLDRHEDL